MYLAPVELVRRSGEIREEFDKLLSRPSVVRRPRSAQWTFLRHCFDVTVQQANGDFSRGKAQILQYKYEVEERLRRYYLGRGEPVRFIFQLVHRAHAVERGIVDEAYPSSNGYVLLVSEEASAPRAERSVQSVREELERVVAEALEAEWAVYRRLPEVDLSPLDGLFLPEGSALLRIRHLVERHHERRWTIRQPELNPSTKRLLDIKVLKIGEDEAWVRTREYWYLRWYSLKLGDYARIDYRETNSQKYILKKRGDRWLVEMNIYPPPRAQTPHRKRIVVG